MMARLRESRWVYVLLSILLAIIFWAYIRAAVDPDGSILVHNVRVDTTGTNVLTSQGLAISEISPQTVELRVSGPNSARTDLLRNRSGLSVIVDVSRCVEGENTLRYREVWPETINADELSAQTSTVTVTVEKLYTKPFDVQFQLDGRVAEGYQMGTPAIEPEKVIISGPVDQVNQVASVAAVLRSEELSERFAGDLTLTPLDKQGSPLTGLEITLSADTAYVIVPVVKTKEVALTVNVIPGGGATEEDANISFEGFDSDPPTIIVSGTETDLEGLEEISLGSVDLSDVIGSKAFTFPIALDPSLTNESGLTSVEVTVSVQGLNTAVFAAHNITTTQPPNGLTAEVITMSLPVTIRGQAEDLANIDSTQIRVVADLSDVNTLGSRQVPARVYLDNGSTVGVVGKYTVVVNLS
ncbi:MAG: hypothetical protein HFF44_01575 [Lawsonibacter sp.]|nr:hypothetical protein [Lawsonibacter sp.]